MGNTSGSILKMVLNGVPYNVPFDANLTINLSAFETEGIPCTGKTMMKKILRMPTVEGCVALTTPLTAERLKALAESTENFTIAFEMADGSTYRGKGQINYESLETEEMRSMFTLIPDKTKGAWTLFAA